MIIDILETVHALIMLSVHALMMATPFALVGLIMWLAL